jgi:fumarate hydratase class II
MTNRGVAFMLTDSMGAIEVPADRYGGAESQRSLIHFSIGDDRMPKAVYHAYGYAKKAAAIAGGRAGRLRGMERHCGYGKGFQLCVWD